jgi:hypothetical protein
MSFSKLILASLVAAFALAIGVSTATALRSIQITNIPAEEVKAESVLTFGEREAGGRLRPERQIICNVTLLRTISTLIPKRTGVLFGKVTGVAIDRRSCRSPIGGIEEIAVLLSEGDANQATHRELGNRVLLYDLRPAPAENWKLIYDSFQGELPTITGLNFHIQNTFFRIRVFFNCLFHGEAFGLIAIERATGTVTGASAVLGLTRLPRAYEAFCPIANGTGTFSGNFSIPALRIRLL